MVERQVFIDTIVACVRKYACNGRHAIDELMRAQQYEAGAATFSVLVALVHLDAGPAVSRLLAEVEPDFFVMLADQTVAGVVNTWLATPLATVDNTATMMLRLALEQRAFTAVAALMAEQRLADTLTYAFYRSTAATVAAELRTLKAHQSDKAVLVPVDEQWLTRTTELLEDGGTRALRDALLAVARLAERSRHVRREPNTAAESARIESEIARDRAQDGLRKLKRIETEARQCLQLITNDALDLLQQATTRRPDTGAAADDDNAATWLAELEASIAQYEERQARPPASAEPPTLVERLQSQSTAITALRSLIDVTQQVARHASQTLVALEMHCATSTQAAHADRIAEFAAQIQQLDADAYLQ